MKNIESFEDAHVVFIKKISKLKGDNFLAFKGKTIHLMVVSTKLKPKFYTSKLWYILGPQLSTDGRVVFSDDL